MKHYEFIAWDYKGKLVKITTQAETKTEAEAIVRDMCINSKYIDSDEGILYSNEY